MLTAFRVELLQALCLYQAAFDQIHDGAIDRELLLFRQTQHFEYDFVLSIGYPPLFFKNRRVVMVAG